MALPTGSGSERIKYTKIAALTNSDQNLITGVALHIYTVLSIIVCETVGGAGEKIQLRITDSDGSSNECFILQHIPVGVNETFVFNDRFSFDGDKKLIINAIATADLDVICSYIDQDWT